jgi:hypothetical protein
MDGTRPKRTPEELRRDSAGPTQPSRRIYLDLPALTFAQRALAAREIFLRAEALIFRRLRPLFLTGALDPFVTTASSCD